MLKQDDHFCLAVSVLKCDHHGHLAGEGRVHRAKGYGWTILVGGVSSTTLIAMIGEIPEGVFFISGKS
jgi:hypothetical protein